MNARRWAPIVNRRSLATLCVAATGLGLFLAVLGTLFRAGYGFSGDVCVMLGASERMAVRPVEPGLFPLAAGGAQILRNVSPQEIPFENPAVRGRLGSETRFDAARLPFSLHLEDATVLRRPGEQDTLVAVGPQTRTTYPLIRGKRFELATNPVEVVAIRKWAGLLRDANGIPMVALAMQRGTDPWVEHVFVAAGTWRRVEPDTGIHLVWRNSEADTRQVEDQEITALGGERWGVVDAAAVHWFSSFAPGTGLDLPDGTSITLLQLEEGSLLPTGPRPFITVRIQRGDDVQTMRVPANERSNTARVRFEDPSQFETVLCFYGWRDGSVTLSPYHQRQRLPHGALAEGETCRVTGTDWTVRLEQALSSAAPVKEDENPFQEAVLQTVDRELHLRQGETVQWGDLRLEFQRVAPPPVVRYQLVIRDDGRTESTCQLGPRKKFHYRGWTFSQGNGGMDADQTAIVHAARTPGNGLIIAGAMVSIMGFAGLGLMRVGRRSTR